MLLSAIQVVSASPPENHVLNVDKVSDGTGGYYVTFNAVDAGITNAYYSHVSHNSQANPGWLSKHPNVWTLISESDYDCLNPQIVLEQSQQVLHVLWGEIQNPDQTDFYYVSSDDGGNEWTIPQYAETTDFFNWWANFNMIVDEYGILSIWWQNTEQLLVSPDMDADGIPDDLQQVEVDPDVSGATLLTSNRMRVGLANIVNISDLQVSSTWVNDTEYQNLSMPGIEWGFTNEVGKPKLPVLRKYIAVPYDAEFNVEIFDSSYIIEENYTVYPVPKIVLQTGEFDNETSPMGVEEFYINETFYSTDIYYPEEIVSFEIDTYLRNYRVLLLNIAPFQFNPVTRELKVYHKITFTTEFGQTGINAEQPQEQGADGGYFNEIYSNLIINYQASADWGVIESTNPGQGEVLSAPPPNEINPPDIGYLIITHDDFADNQALLDLAQWRAEHNGFIVGIIATSTICIDDNINDDIEIKEYITYGMENMGIAYVLLVGDAEFIVPHEVEGGIFGAETTTSDNWFVDPNDDHIPDMKIGRFSIAINSELEVISNKVITYESELDWGEWRDNIALIAGSADSVGIIAHNELDELYQRYGWKYDTTKIQHMFGGTGNDIIQALNEGQLIVNYDDHGGSNTWYNRNFLTSFDVQSLTNGPKLPVVFSMACLTGMFDYPYSNMDVQLIKEDTIIAIVGSGNLKIYESVTGNFIQDFKFGIPIYGIEESPNGDMLAIKGGDSLIIMDISGPISTWNVMNTFSFAHTNNQGLISWSPIGSRICIAKGDYDYNNNVWIGLGVTIYDVSNADTNNWVELGSLEYGTQVVAFDFSPDGKTIVVATNDIIDMWDIQSSISDEWFILSSTSSLLLIRCIDWSTDGSKIVTGSNNPSGGGTIIIWDSSMLTQESTIYIDNIPLQTKWSNVGDSIAVSTSYTSPDNSNTELILISNTGPNPNIKQLFHVDSFQFFYLDWSEDDTSIIFAPSGPYIILDTILISVDTNEILLNIGRTSLTCIGEEFLLTPNGGAVAFFGASETASCTSLEILNDYLFEDIFEQGMHIIGDVILDSKIRFYTNTPDRIYQLEMYTLFGDPAFEINLPDDVEVTVTITDPIPIGGIAETNYGETMKVYASVSDLFNGLVEINTVDFLTNDINLPIYGTVIDGELVIDGKVIDGISNFIEINIPSNPVDAHYGLGAVYVKVWNDVTKTNGINGAKFYIPPAYDLYLNSNDITLVPMNPIENSNIGIAATIHKNGNVGADATIYCYYTKCVQLWNGEPFWLDEKYIGCTNFQISENQDEICVFVPWIGEEGGNPYPIYRIRILIAWANPSEDSSNNIATKDFWLKTYVDPSFETQFDINFIPRWSYASEGVEITANVHNLGDADILSTTLEFYNGDPENGGIYIGESTVDNIMANGGSSTSTATTWTTISGEHEIFARIINSNPPEESSYLTNNQISRRIYGMTSHEVPEFTFSDGQNSKTIEFDETTKVFPSSITIPNMEVTYATMDIEGQERLFEDVDGTLELLLPGNVDGTTVRPVSIAFDTNGLLYFLSRDRSSIPPYQSSLWHRANDGTYSQIGSSFTHIDMVGLEFHPDGSLYLVSRRDDSTSNGKLYHCPDVTAVNPIFNCIGDFNGYNNLPLMQIWDIAINELGEGYISGSISINTISKPGIIKITIDESGCTEIVPKRILELDYNPIGIAVVDWLGVDNLCVIQTSTNTGIIHRFVDTDTSFNHVGINTVNYKAWGACFLGRQLYVQELAAAGSPSCIYKYEWGYPIMPTFDIGNDGTLDWQVGGVYRNKETTLNYADAINNYISTHQFDVVDGYIEVPITFYSNSAGILRIHEIATISYYILIPLETGIEDQFIDLDWSPDGSTCLLVANSATSPVENVVVKFDGTHFTEVYRGNPSGNAFFRRISWCPDGSYALIGSMGGKVYKYDATDDSVSLFYTDQITDEYFYDISWQPDMDDSTPGYQGMALMTGYSVSTADILLTYDGTSFTRTYTYTAGILRHGQWRNDGQYAIITGDYGSIFTFDGSIVTFISSSIGESSIPYWSPDDSTCLLMTHTTLYSFDGSSILFLTNTPDAMRCYGLDWYDLAGYYTMTSDNGRLIRYFPAINDIVSIDTGVPDKLYGIKWNPDFSYALVIGEDGHLFKYLG